jgi:hypothetical protein
MDEPDEYIDFMAKYKDWISFRRLGIRPNTTPQEVVYHLAGIRTTIDGKACSLLGIKVSTLDSFAKSATSGLKKKDLATAVAKIDSPEGKAAIDASCENKDITSLAKAYLLNKIITELGLFTGVDQKEMSTIWKELKPPKAPGMGRKKKANPEV